MDAKTASTLECCTPGAVVGAGGEVGGWLRVWVPIASEHAGLHVMWL